MNRVSKRIPTMKTGVTLMMTEKGEMPETGLSRQEIIDFANASAKGRPLFPVATKDIPLSKLDRYTDIDALRMPPPPIRPPRPSTVDRPFQPINRLPPPPINVETLNMEDVINLLDDNVPEDLRVEPLADLMPQLLDQ